MIILYIPFSDKVGLPLHNIISPFLPVMDILSVDLKFCHIIFYSLTMSFLVFQSVFFLQLYGLPIGLLPSTLYSIHFFTQSSSFYSYMSIPSQSTISNNSCSLVSVFHGNATHPSASLLFRTLIQHKLARAYYRFHKSCCF